MPASTRRSRESSVVLRGANAAGHARRALPASNYVQTFSCLLGAFKRGQFGRAVSGCEISRTNNLELVVAVLVCQRCRVGGAADLGVRTMTY